MNINKGQAIFDYLPDSWIEYSENKRFYSAKVINWNTKPVAGLYQPFFVSSINDMIMSFGRREGNVDKFRNFDIQTVDFVEASMNEEIPDIICEVNPLFFYCDQCHDAYMINSSHTAVNKECPTCHRRLKQLQYVYSCRCGFASGVSIPANAMNKSPKFYPAREEKDRFIVYYKLGKLEKPEQMMMKCPVCGTWLYPKNADDRVHFTPMSVTSINLFDKKFGSFLESGRNSYLALIANRLGLIDEDTLERIIKDPALMTDAEVNEAQEQKIMEFMRKFPGSTREMALSLLQEFGMDLGAQDSIHKALKRTDEVIRDIPERELGLLANELVEFHTVAKAVDVLTLDNSKNEALRMGLIEDGRELDEVNRKYGILNVQRTANIELVTASFAYTRQGIDPSAETSRSWNAKLTLIPFFSKNKYRVFVSKNLTEGILIEFSRGRILQWLIDNEVVQADIDVNDDDVARKWFFRHINRDRIDFSSEILIDSTNADSICTKMTYCLIHTMAHLLIKSAGLNSGIGKESLAEIIFPSIPAVFIYSTGVQGISLGSLSSMFESNYKGFIEDAFELAETCMLDPICSEDQNGRCISCLYLSEVSCSHFNKDLSRNLLNGGTYTISQQITIPIKRGFLE